MREDNEVWAKIVSYLHSSNSPSHHQHLQIGRLAVDGHEWHQHLIISSNEIHLPSPSRITCILLITNLLYSHSIFFPFHLQCTSFMWLNRISYRRSIRSDISFFKIQKQRQPSIISTGMQRLPIRQPPMKFFWLHLNLQFLLYLRSKGQISTTKFRKHCLVVGTVMATQYIKRQVNRQNSVQYQKIIISRKRSTYYFSKFNNDI